MQQRSPYVPKSGVDSTGTLARPAAEFWIRPSVRGLMCPRYSLGARRCRMVASSVQTPIATRVTKKTRAKTLGESSLS